MKHFIRLAVVTVLITAVGQTLAANPLKGTWFGIYRADASTVLVQVEFWYENGQLCGTAEIPGAGIYQHPLSWIIFEGNSVHFEVVRGTKALVFDGKLEGGKVTGTFKSSNATGTFYLEQSPLAKR